MEKRVLFRSAWLPWVLLAPQLVVNAGHGLHYHNVQPIAALPGINELNIGHAIVAQAVFVGFKQAVRDMAELIRCNSVVK